jgi:hypothetical protein
MVHGNTVFQQLLQIFSRHEFDQLAEQHHAGQKFPSFNRWTQFGAMIMGQLTGQKSLRDIVANMSAHSRNSIIMSFSYISLATLEKTSRQKTCRCHRRSDDFPGSSHGKVSPGDLPIS